MKRTYRSYTDEDIVNAVPNVHSLSKLLKVLNLKRAGGNFTNMKRILQNLSVDTSHWTGQAWSKDQQLKDWSEYTHTRSVKKQLIKTRGHKCEDCDRTQWKGADIPLEIHHVDGDKTNNTYDNLQLMCPNCHAMTDNWRNRTRKWPGS